MAAAYVYIMANRYRGTTYIGVTTNLSRRANEHRTGRYPGFTKRYGLRVLVHYEPFDWIEGAIQRESQLKAWKRNWKIRLIEERNPEWKDLYEQLNQ